jgi:hypothetical protein
MTNNVTDDLANARFLSAIRKAHPGIGGFSAHAILTAVYPLIAQQARNAALDLAAKVAKGYDLSLMSSTQSDMTARGIAAAILALKGKP